MNEIYRVFQKKKKKNRPPLPQSFE